MTTTYSIVFATIAVIIVVILLASLDKITFWLINRGEVSRGNRNGEEPRGIIRANGNEKDFVIDDPRSNFYSEDARLR